MSAVVELNNHAVLCLQKHQQEDAFYLYRMALNSMKNTFLRRASNVVGGTTKEESSSISPPSCSTCKLSGWSSPGDDMDMDHNHDDNFGSLSSDIFDGRLLFAAKTVHPSAFLAHQHHVLAIQSSPIRSISDALHSTDQSFVTFFRSAFFLSIDEEDMTSAVVLYNMGLISHIRGADTGSNDMLDGALKLYNMSLSILESMSSLPRGAQVLALALYNNLAHIHSLRFNQIDTREFLELLSITVENLVLTEINEDDYSFFSLNVLLNERHQDFALAPAA